MKSHFSQKDSSPSQTCRDDDNAETPCVQCNNQMTYFFYANISEKKGVGDTTKVLLHDVRNHFNSF